MKEIIQQVSNSFLKEAQASPRMLEDLAAMEKYMSESYDGRTFIELLQNADDAGAKTVCVSEIGDAVIVANDGRSFNENDIISICRSGASSKRRGNSIGYRGVGFKSTTVISTEIVIYSSDVYFTFSKTLCAETLSVACDKVPTVRIPFIYEDSKLSSNIKNELLRLKVKGFNTSFVFLKANINKFLSELKEFDSSWLLFLNNVVSVEINMKDVEQKCLLTRKNKSEYERIVTIEGNRKSWYIIYEGDIGIAFLYDSQKGFVPCSVDEAVLHCFLPMIDKSGFAFKINADFSTDPSRKHLIQDDMTKLALSKVAKLLANFVENIFTRKDDKFYGIIGLIGKRVSLTTASIGLENQLIQELAWREWILLEDDSCVKAKEAKLLPGWMSERERKEIIEAIPSLKKRYISSLLYDQIEIMILLLKKIGVEEIDSENFRKILTTENIVNGLKNELTAKIFVYEGRTCFNDKKWVGEVCLPTKLGLISVKNCSNNSYFNDEYCKTLQQLLNNEEWNVLIGEYSIYEKIKSQKVKRPSLGANLKRNTSKKAQLAINKWKTPIQNCVAVEVMNGFSAKDISKKCDEYSVMSVDANGKTRYILVVPVAHIGDTIKISEKQYSAAQRIGEDYELFVIATESSDTEYIYIKNPYENVKLNRVVKEWEWVCDKYDQTKKIETSPNAEAVDDYLLKNILPEYFNSQQRNFLQEIVQSDMGIIYTDKYKMLIEQINNIVDFYTGQKIIRIINNTIEIPEDKKKSLKKILTI